MIDDGIGAFTVMDGATILATEVSRVAAHEFVHPGCSCRASGQEHANDDALLLTSVETINGA